jgi:hypothetical protein
LRKLSDSDLNVTAQLEKQIVTSPSVPTKVVMLTGGAFGGIENCVSKFCKRKEITSFLVVDNWDNLSSKSIFWNLPNYIGVWGETMRQDAIEIQKFQSYQVKIIGSSRIFPNTRKFLESGDDSSACVTFFGSGWQFSNELNLVKVAAKIISENSEGLTLVYRPHPAYLNRSIIEKIKSEITLFRNAKLDSEFQFDYDNLEWYESDSLLHIKRLILDSKFVIGAHSTSLVESLHYGKSVIAFSASDNPIFQNGDAWQGYSHMLQIRGIQGVFEARSIDEFKERIKQLVSECESPLGEVKSYNYSDSTYFTNFRINICGKIERILKLELNSQDYLMGETYFTP